MPITLFRNKSRCDALPADGRGKERPHSADEGADKLFHLPVRAIAPNPAQPRKEFDEGAITALADSIRRYGVLQPLAVRTVFGEGGEEQYELIAGERRLRAAAEAGLEVVPCLILDADERQSAELAIIENLQREGLNMFEQAAAIAALLEIYDLTQEQVAERLSVSQSYVANKLRLLRLPEEEQKLILEHHLTERHARALLRLTEAPARMAMLRCIVERNLNVAETEECIERLLREREEAAHAPRRRCSGAIKDIRLFYNSVHNALDIIRRSGIEATGERRELDDAIELTIRINKTAAMKRDEAEGRRLPPLPANL